ncbi:hypothetical protein CCUS01_05679 [Colletotrichum cuscutae]|uniref:Uncharacterized protein n=1 Tax=Colletotrichum cuscutae TaxID=1209917 RepID=A0AAI9VA33_9PEZI|nr:hypothetical protein CCUS01_05679 [Colletotrichum cuscutae]
MSSIRPPSYALKLGSREYVVVNAYLSLHTLKQAISANTMGRYITRTPRQGYGYRAKTQMALCHFCKSIERPGLDWLATIVKTWPGYCSEDDLVTFVNLRTGKVIPFKSYVLDELSHTLMQIPVLPQDLMAKFAEFSTVGHKPATVILKRCLNSHLTSASSKITGAPLPNT